MEAIFNAKKKKKVKFIFHKYKKCCLSSLTIVRVLYWNEKCKKWCLSSSKINHTFRGTKGYIRLAFCSNNCYVFSFEKDDYK
ncbi:hypothetical protein LguiA_003283 [Lonicera macranthoides]